MTDKMVALVLFAQASHAAMGWSSIKVVARGPAEICITKSLMIFEEREMLFEL